MIKNLLINEYFRYLRILFIETFVMGVHGLQEFQEILIVKGLIQSAFKEGTLKYD